MPAPETDRVAVTVAYADAGRQLLLPVTVDAGSPVGAAIEASGLFDLLPQLRAQALAVGVFNRVCSVDTPVHAGDRIEIYRPLTIDPLEGRRLRAALKNERRR